MNNKISVIGMGKLGLPMMAVSASKGYDVIGYDINKKIVSKINNNNIPFYEKDLKKYLLKFKNKISVTSNLNEAVMNTRISFLVLPTPSKRNHEFDNKYLINSIKSIAKILKFKNKYHLINVVSTVMPQTCEKIFVNLIEKYSNKKVGKDIGLTYSPEFIALGTVIKDMLYPDKILIGQFDKKSGVVLESYQRKIVGSKVPFLKMGLTEAEITKIAVNTFVTNKISYANLIGNICDEVENVNADKVSKAIGTDNRIGTQYLKPAIGFGGPCFPRDNKAFISFLNKHSLNSYIPKATDLTNNDQINLILKKIKKKFKNKRIKISILGLSYKPDTAVVEESQGIKLANKLITKNYKIFVHDPMAIDNAKIFLNKRIKIIKSLMSNIRGTDLIIIMTPWKQYKNNKILSLINKLSKELLDPWSLIKK